MSAEHPEKALNLDLTQQRNFIRYFNNLSQKPATTIRIFNRTEYYSVHGDDAVFASKHVGVPLKIMGDQPQLSYMTLSKGQFEIFLRDLLLVKQYRVEMYMKHGKQGNDWQLEFKGSPGNYQQFEDILFGSGSVEFTNCVLGIKICSNKNLAVSCVNVTDARFEVCELTDTDIFSEIQGIIAQIGPRECLIPAGDTPDLVNLKTVLERNDVLVTTVKKSDFSTNESELIQDLNRLLYFHEDQQRNAACYTETNLKEAMSCLQAIIKFLNLTSEEKNFNLFTLHKLEANRFLKLNPAALNALNIFPNTRKSKVSERGGIKAAKYSSLKGVLDYCVTSQGLRLLEQWLKQPILDQNLINERLDIVERLIKESEARTRLAQEILPRLTDLMPLVKKITGKRAKLQDYFTIYMTVYNLPVLAKVLRDTMDKCVINLLVNPLDEFISDMSKFQDMIDETLDFEMAQKREFLVKPSFSEDLQELQEKKEKLLEKMQRELNKVNRDLSFESGKGVKLEYTEQLGYFFRLTLKDERALRKQTGYKVLATLKSGVRFASEKLAELNEEYKETNKEYEEKQQSIVDKIGEVADGYTECLRNINSTFAQIDVFASLATAAISAPIPYVRPKLHPMGTGVLKLTKARHPCLEYQDRVSYVPNDVSFEKDGTLLHVVTGPNMCGKSTYIRSIAICVLMAQIGSFVPCSKAEVSIADGIFVRLGAEDCQAKGLSTFMMEMIETSSILKNSTANSLVIIDELGRGTSTYDGLGMAWAVSEHLATKIKCFSLFATHYHEISDLADKFSAVNNLHVTAVTTDTTITPLYQVREGECDKSYGIHCARLADFPQNVTKEAEEVLKLLEFEGGLKYVSDYEPSLKRRVIAEGDALIEDTLTKLKSIKCENSEEYALTKKKLMEELLASGNMFIKGLSDSIDTNL